MHHEVGITLLVYPRVDHIKTITLGKEKYGVYIQQTMYLMVSHTDLLSNHIIHRSAFLPLQRETRDVVKHANE